VQKSAKINYSNFDAPKAANSLSQGFFAASMCKPYDTTAREIQD
jgi:hypothetical protein